MLDSNRGKVSCSAMVSSSYTTKQKIQKLTQNLPLQISTNLLEIISLKALFNLVKSNKTNKDGKMR